LSCGFMDGTAIAIMNPSQFIPMIITPHLVNILTMDLLAQDSTRKPVAMAIVLDIPICKVVLNLPNRKKITFRK